MDPTYAPLFEPYTLNNGVEIKNRLTVAPLTIYDQGPDGEITEANRRFWKDRIRGFGLYIMPFTNVHPSAIGFESPQAISESNLPALTEYAEIAHGQGVRAVVQLAHAGAHANRAMTKGYDVIAPTGHVLDAFRTMTDAEVRELIHSFANAAELALRAGFDGVEIHGANGFLVQQFVSAATNLRTDHWGGDLAKRMRFSLEIIDAIDAVRREHDRPDFIIGYRFSPEEPGARGLTMADTLNLVDALVDKPLQYLHVSLWDFYKRVRRGANQELTRMQVLHDRIAGRLPLIGVGNLYTADQILEAYRTGWAEFIAVGKSVLLNPNLAELIETGRQDEIQTVFDWDRADEYRYTPAMLEGTRMGADFYPPSKQYGVSYVTEKF